MYKMKFTNPEFDKVVATVTQLKRQMHGNSFGGENKILHYLAHHINHNNQRGILPTEICRVGHMTSARVASALNVLQTKGLIKRTRSTEDKRQVFVNITEKGIKMLRKRMQYMVATFSRIFNELDKTDRSNLISILEKITIIASKHTEKGK